MTTILRFILLFLLAPAFAIVAQAAATAQDGFRIVDADLQTKSVILDSTDGENCNYDSSGALLQQCKSIDGKAADEDDLSGCQELETSEAEQSFFSFLAELVAANKGSDFAKSAFQGKQLNQHLRQLEKYGKAGSKQLENGRMRYYGEVTPASKPGAMAGRRVVREWDPSTGNTRTWMETVDHSGNVRIVRPETGGTKTHYMFDEHGNFTGTF